MARVIRQFFYLGLAFVPVACIAAPESTGKTTDAVPIEARAFSTPDDAVKALLDVARNGKSEGIAALFGSSGAELFSSGDEVADKNNRESFVAMAGEKTRIDAVGADRAIVHVGQEDWPFPIPLVKSADGWRFDVDQGREEILNRRIGRNELGALATLNGYVEAQFEYANVDWNGDGVAEFAQKLRSEPEQFDGLFWEDKPGQPVSPLGPLVAKARAEGYQLKSTAEHPSPYHGYFYRILSRQGKEAPGGQYDYVINGRMIAGFGMVAFPAQYGSSGIMTFIVSHQGKIYQKDLGPETARIVADLKEYNPDSGWDLVETVE